MTDIDIWCIKHDSIIKPFEEKNLSQDERNKAAQFKFQYDKKKYLNGHIKLRKVLSIYCPEILPSQWIFNINRFGKPYIKNGLLHKLYFNMSYCKTYTYIAVCKETEVGIDVTTIDDMHQLLTDKQFFNYAFTQKEQVTLENNLYKFYRLWSSKEAYLKLLGTGFSIKPSEIDFSKLFSAESASYFDNDKQMYVLVKYDKERNLILSCAVKGEKDQKVSLIFHQE